MKRRGYKVFRYFKFGWPRRICQRKTSELDMADKKKLLGDLGYKDKIAHRDSKGYYVPSHSNHLLPKSSHEIHNERERKLPHNYILS